MIRLDILLATKKLVRSRKVAHDLIKSGKVLVNGEIILKPAKEVLEDPEIIISEQPKYVGRGGLKLEKALTEFIIDPTNLIILDVGSSTGGFTDCLIQGGAKKIYAVDVGTNQLDAKLKNNPKIISLEKTDIRDIIKLPEKPDLAVIDVSFISLELILKKVSNLLKSKAKIIVLIKPQFETSKEEKNRSGIVKNDEIRNKVLNNIRLYCQNNNLNVQGIIDSPILGGSGNKEYLLLLQKNN